MASPRFARLRRRTGLTLLSAVALAAGTLATTPAAQSATSGTPAPNPYSPAVHHPYRHGVVPTRAVANKMNGYTRSHPSARAAASSSNLNYGGGIDGIGVTTGHQKVYMVFYGSQWGTAGTDANGDTTLSGDPQGLAPYQQRLYKGLGTNGELWSGVLTQYCEGIAAGSQTCPSTAAHVAYPTGGALAGVWVDESTASPQQADGHTLAVEAINAAAHFGNTTAAANRNAQYIIVSPTGTHPDGFNTSGAGFCAWHDYNGDSTLTGGAASSPYGDIAFTNSPYVPDAGSGCGQNFVNGNGTLDGVSIVEGHEYAETVTDQNPAGGWTDSSGQENGDKCAWISPGQPGGAADLSTATGSFAMQATWGNDGAGGAGACEFTHPIVGGGSSGGGGGITNGGFETGSLSGWTTSGPATSVTTGGPHSGSYAALLGDPNNPTNGASNIAQTFTASSGTSTLSFWYNVTCPDTVTYDWATATLKDNTTGTTQTVLPKTCVSNSGWTQVTASVTAGHSYTLTLTSKDDNYVGDPTSTLYDDVTLS